MPKQNKTEINNEYYIREEMKEMYDIFKEEIEEDRKRITCIPLNNNKNINKSKILIINNPKILRELTLNILPMKIWIILLTIK